MWLISTTPFSTAIPNSAMKPTLAERLRFNPRSQSIATPPTSANGTFVSTSAVCQLLRNDA